MDLQLLSVNNKGAWINVSRPLPCLVEGCCPTGGWGLEGLQIRFPNVSTQVAHSWDCSVSSCLKDPFGLGLSLFSFQICHQPAKAKESECFLQRCLNRRSCLGRAVWVLLRTFSRRFLHQGRLTEGIAKAFLFALFFFYYLREQCMMKKIIAFKTEMTSFFIPLVSLRFLICTMGIITPFSQGCERNTYCGVSKHKAQSELLISVSYRPSSSTRV